MGSSINISDISAFVHFLSHIDALFSLPNVDKNLICSKLFFFPSIHFVCRYYFLPVFHTFNTYKKISKKNEDFMNFTAC